MPVIQLKDVAYCYCDRGVISRALLDVNLTIDNGEFVCIVGHSGCGKSTLLSLLAGLLKPSCGQILIDGTPLNGPDPSRAMVFQHYSLFPWMRVQANVAFSIQHSLHLTNKRDAQKKALVYLEKVGMEQAKDKFPFQLSGGMQQRVALARALAMQSDTLLLDEPFGALDAKNRLELQQLLIHLWEIAETKPTVVFVTHDLDEALLLADRIVFMRPESIMGIYEVPFKRPRNLETLALQSDYQELKATLFSNFYESLAEDSDDLR